MNLFDMPCEFYVSDDVITALDPEEAHNKHHVDPFMEIKNSIKSVHYNPPYTTILFKNGETSVVRCMDGTEFDPYVGFCAALTKKIFGSNSSVNAFTSKEWNRYTEKEEKKFEKNLKKASKKKSANVRFTIIFSKRMKPSSAFWNEIQKIITESLYNYKISNFAPKWDQITWECKASFETNALKIERDVISKFVFEKLQKFGYSVSTVTYNILM